MEPLCVQYTAYNQRRLHYSLLFWACLALQCSGILLTLLFGTQQIIIGKPVLFALLGISSLLMSFIALRLHGLEVHYENCLRRIEETWLEQNIIGIKKGKITGGLSSRKLVIFALACLGIAFLMFAIRAH